MTFRNNNNEWNCVLRLLLLAQCSNQIPSRSHPAHHLQNGKGNSSQLDYTERRNAKTQLCLPNYHPNVVVVGRLRNFASCRYTRIIGGTEKNVVYDSRVREIIDFLRPFAAAAR